MKTWCSRNRDGQSTQNLPTSIGFKSPLAIGSKKSSYEPRISTAINNHLKLVRDQGVGGSNPLSPTISDSTPLDSSTGVRFHSRAYAVSVSISAESLRGFNERAAGRLSELTVMARLARVIAVEVAHHVTQRGNAKQYILQGDADREVYLSLLRENLERHNASLIGYCLMSTHVHLVMVPRQPMPWRRYSSIPTEDMPLTGMRGTGRAGMCGRGGTIPVLWTGRTCGRRCATRN